MNLERVLSDFDRAEKDLVCSLSAPPTAARNFRFLLRVFSDVRDDSRP